MGRLGHDVGSVAGDDHLLGRAEKDLARRLAAQAVERFGKRLAQGLEPLSDVHLVGIARARDHHRAHGDQLGHVGGPEGQQAQRKKYSRQKQQLTQLFHLMHPP